MQIRRDRGRHVRARRGESSAAGSLREVRESAKGGEDKGREWRPGPLRRLVDHWWDRLIGAVYSGSLADQTAQYSAHHAKRDYFFNSIGMGVWGGLFPILTVIATHLSGAEQAGMFAMAFVIANLLQFIGNYGVRTFQVSDIDEAESFDAYQIHRYLACFLMVAVGYLFCVVRGYGGDMLVICCATFAFRAIDAVADVYEGRLQQLDKLYLSGISQIVRCALVVVVFTFVLVISRSIPAASIAMAIASAVTLVGVTIPPR